MLDQRRPVLRDVAREACVSHMTVSRVVRGDRRVADATRARVETAIARLGYRPDPSLSALAAYRTRGGGGQGSVLAFLHCDTAGFSRLVFDGAWSEAGRLGYSVESHQLSRLPAAQRRLGRTLVHRGVRGLLFGPSQNPWKFEGWEWEHFAAVSLGALSHHPPMNSVALDYFDGVVKAVEYLRAHGSRRVGLAVDAALEFRTGHRWLGGYLTRQLPCRIPAYTGNPADRKALMEWSRRHRIDGVLTIHKSVWFALRARVPHFAFLNAFECPSGVACVDFDARRIGIEAVRTIHHQLLNREFGLPAEVKSDSLQGCMVLRQG
jgi:LacI family transcriptional regulator